MSSEKPVLKLYYFAGLRGRVEHIRQLLNLANVPFEEVGITAGDWPTFKKEMPLGQVPVLEVDGVKIGQSVAIARYLGERFGLSPKEPLERAQLDMIVDQISDTMNAGPFKEWAMICLGITAGDKSAFFREKVRPQLDACAEVIENYLVAQGDKCSTLLCKEEITWVDMYVAEFFSKFVDFGEKDCLEAFPHIKAMVERVHNVPAIKKHIATRVPGPF